MEGELDHTQNVSDPSSSNSNSISNEGPLSSEPVREEEEEQQQQLAGQRQDGDHDHDHRHRHRHHHHRSSGVSYRLNISISDRASTYARDDIWSCLIVVVTFWFFAASMTLILGFYGSVNLQLGPYCSRLVQANSLFVQSIKAQEIDGSKNGAMLYGFYETPPLDVEITWFETHNAIILSSFHKEWQYFLNGGSEVDISYRVKSPSSVPLSLVIAQGRSSLANWIEDPSYPNMTLSWNIIHGTGRIHQKILKSNMYYIAVGNLNFEKVEVQLNFTIKGFLYNTSHAHYKCSLDHRSCSVKLFLLRTNAAVLTSPGPQQGAPYDDWYVRQSYGPQWITYFVGSGSLTILMLLAFKICNQYQVIFGGRTEFQAGDMGSERAPLLLPKDDDLSSWDSSWDSTSHDEEELDDRHAVSLDGKPPKEGESKSNPRRQCSICLDAPRDCFFLPCGHCTACFTCGTKVVEEAGTCPICRRTMKKVRKIFTV